MIWFMLRKDENQLLYDNTEKLCCTQLDLTVPNAIQLYPTIPNCTELDPAVHTNYTQLYPTMPNYT